MKEGNKNRKEEILSHHTEVNVDEIWAAIEPQVDLINAEKKRKKRFLIFFLFGAALLASSALYLWQYGNEGIVENIEIESHNGIANKKEETTLQEKEKQSTQKSQNIDNQSLENKNLNTNDELINTNIKDKVNANTNSKNPSESAINSNKQAALDVNSNYFIKLDGKGEILPNNDLIIQQANTTTTKIIEEKAATEKEFSLAEKSASTPPKPLTLSPQISTLHLRLPNSIPEIGEPDIPRKEKGNNDNEDESQLPGGKLSFAVSANTGISFINRGLAINTDSEAAFATLSLRRESETLLEAIHYGVRGKLTHKSGFSFSTGTQYTVMTERYNNNKIEVASDSIEGIVKRIVQFNGDTLDIAGTLPRTTTYDYEKEIYNRYRMIDVPFILGYEGGMKEWSLGIQAGVFVNLALKTSGQVRNSTTEDLNIGDNQADIFKDKVGLSYYGGIYIRRALGPNLDVTVAPHGRFFAQDFNVDSYTLKQRYSLIGIQAGLSYRFGY